MNTQKAAVIGHPIGHTMSPFIQKRLFELSGIPMEYRVIDVPDLEAALPELRKLDCFNVTIPHKSAIIPFLDGLCDHAQLCGSVNTVTVRDGGLYGSTSDGPGAAVALSIHGLSMDGKILLLGNGGAARAVAFMAAQRPDFDLTIVCRKQSEQKANALAGELADFARARGDRHFLICVETYEELEADCFDSAKRFDLLLNTTSVGMYPNVGKSPVSGQVVSRCKAVFDAVYNPRETELLRLAGQAGVKTVGGMGMLVCQAAYSHHIWYGTEFRNEELLQLIEDASAEMERIFGKETP